VYAVLAMTNPRAKRLKLSDKDVSKFLDIDKRLEPELDKIADSIDRFRDKSMAARKERFATLMAEGDVRDWNGKLITELGDLSEFGIIAERSSSLIDAIAQLAPRHQDELAGLLEAYGHPQIEAEQSLDHIHPDLRNYISILERIAEEAKYLTPARKPGQPKLYSSLISDLIAVCYLVGVIGEGDKIPTGSKGKVGRLISLALEIAGYSDHDQPDHGKTIRNSLNYIDRGEADAQREFVDWENSVRKNRGV